MPGDPVERGDEMHLRGAGIGEADLDAAGDQGATRLSAPFMKLSPKTAPFGQACPPHGPTASRDEGWTERGCAVRGAIASSAPRTPADGAKLLERAVERKMSAAAPVKHLGTSAGPP